jgi:Na+/H+ antiporter NhaC
LFLICVIWECLQYGITNKWSNTLNVPKGFQCKFGKIVEIEEEIKEEAVEEKQEIKESKEEIKPKTSFHKSLIWLWTTLIIITLLLIAYFLIKGKE